MMMMYISEKNSENVFLEIQAKLYDDDGEIFVQQHECIAWHSITLYKFHKPPVCSKKQ